MRDDLPIPCNELTFRFHGLRRSGNHAVISWLMSHVEGTIVHLNDIRDRTLDPYRGCEGYEVRGIPYRTCKRGIRDATVYYLKSLAGRKPHVMFYPPYDPLVQVEPLRQVPLKQLLILSYENRRLDDVCSSEYEARRRNYIGDSRSDFDILLLRDPHNLFASMIKSRMLSPQNRDQIVPMWKEHAREFLGTTRTLTYAPVTINYNRWYQEPAYRDGIARSLSFNGASPLPSTVHVAGGGSSFDGRSFHGNAAAMKVLDRWKSYVGDDFYENLFDDEVRTLSDEIFGFVRS
jgi:hypothetical protein